MVPRRQVYELVGDFTVDDPKHHAKIDGYLVGDGVLTSDGTSVTVTPQIVALHVSQIRFNRGVPFATKPVIEDVTALLTGVRDGVNQRWPAYRLAIPLRPLGAPGRPAADLTLDLRDPFDPSRTVATVVSPPTVRALAFVLDDRRLALMGEVTLDSGAVAALGDAHGRATYAGLNDGFKRLATDSGLDASPSKTYQLKSGFQDALLARYLAPVFTRDRLKPAVRQSMAALERPGPVDLGLSVALPVAQNVFKSKVTAALDASAARADLTVKSTSFSAESQSLSAVILATTPIPALSTRADVAMRVHAPIAGGESGVALYPQIDTLVVTHLDTAAFGDLPTLLGGASDALARSVGDVNAALTPEPLGLSDVAIPSLDASHWVASAQGMSASTHGAAPPAMTFADVSVLVVSGRILAVGHAAGDQGSAIAEPAATTMDGSFPAYRGRFLSTWTASFGGAEAGAPAVAYISKRGIAAYVSSAWKDAHVGWRYQGGASEAAATPVLVSALPTAHCRPSAAAAACAAATPVLAQAVKQTIGADGFQLGSLKSQYATRMSVEAADTRLGLSPNLTGALLTANAGGEAHGALAMRMDANSVAGRSSCPADQHWRLPLEGGAYHAARSAGARIRVASSLEPRADGGEALRLRLSSGALSVETQGRSMQSQVLSGVSGDVVQCPTAGLIATAPGASEALKSVELTPATAKLPDVMTKSMHAVRSGAVRDALEGRARHTFVLKTLDIDVNLPTFRALDAGFGATSSLDGDWVKTVAQPRGARP